MSCTCSHQFCVYQYVVFWLNWSIGDLIRLVFSSDIVLMNCECGPTAKFKMHHVALDTGFYGFCHFVENNEAFV